jgi:exodeoxyribonuclease VII large subunit
MVIRKSSRKEQEALEIGPGDESALGMAIPTVSELTRELADLLESTFATVVVQGEISGWNRAASGHTYFTLKDEKACLGAVLWKSRQIRHPIKEGMKVIASGRISVYAPRGQYQLDCVSITPVGAGDLQIAFEELKAKLQAEGLFDQHRKRQLPSFPSRIGVVTSRDGAALRDIVTTLRRRMPTVSVVLRPCLVQGTSAAAEVARAIAELNERNDIDVLIIGRGGGSIEDLWAFNEEIVARAIAASRIPTISAVGHEVDFTIADFVADVRAATPTAAAELAVRDRAELLDALERIEMQLTDDVESLLRRHRQELSYLLRSRGLARPLDIVRSHQQRVDDLTHRSGLGLRAAVLRANERLRLLDAKLRALSPQSVLERGFAIIERDGEPITRSSMLVADDGVTIRMADGARRARVEE